MFTGIITGVGRITHIDDLGTSQAHGKRLHVQCPQGYLDDAGLGDSIAINGACMTVTTLQADAQAPVLPWIYLPNRWIKLPGWKR